MTDLSNKRDAARETPEWKAIFDEAYKFADPDPKWRAEYHARSDAEFAADFIVAAGYQAQESAGGGYPPELLTLTDRLLADITELRCGLEEAITLCDLNFPEWYATNGNERLDACRLILETTGSLYRPEQPEVTVAGGEICPGCGCRIFHPSAICQPAPGGENDAL